MLELLKRALHPALPSEAAGDPPPIPAPMPGPWLLSRAYADHVWRCRDGSTGEEYTLDFRSVLPDGLLLTHPRHAHAYATIIHLGKLCQAVNIGRSALAQNPRIAAKLAELQGRGADDAATAPPASIASGARTRRDRERDDQLKTLRADKERLEEEVRYLKTQLRRHGFADEVLPNIGRLPW
jgi:hypothetical protein